MVLERLNLTLVMRVPSYDGFDVVVLCAVKYFTLFEAVISKKEHFLSILTMSWTIIYQEQQIITQNSHIYF
jgi:hypothetical protein